MKKVGIASLALFSLVLAGCGEAGTYKPHSIKLGEETYKCGGEAPTEAYAATSFANFCGGDSITLKSNGKGKTGDNTFFWKVKKGKVYLKDNKDDEWEETTYTYKSGKITYKVTVGTSEIVAVYKK